MRNSWGNFVDFMVNGAHKVFRQQNTDNFTVSHQAAPPPTQIHNQPDVSWNKREVGGSFVCSVLINIAFDVLLCVWQGFRGQIGTICLVILNLVSRHLMDTIFEGCFWKGFVPKAVLRSIFLCFTTVAQNVGTCLETGELLGLPVLVVVSLGKTPQLPYLLIMVKGALRHLLSWNRTFFI